MVGCQWSKYYEHRGNWLPSCRSDSERSWRGRRPWARPRWGLGWCERGNASCASAASPRHWKA